MLLIALWLGTLIGGLLMGVAGLAHLARANRFPRCPACQVKALDKIGEDPRHGELSRAARVIRQDRLEWTSPRVEHFHCGNCGDEFRRTGRSTQFISKQAWDAGTRMVYPLPVARVIH